MLRKITIILTLFSLFVGPSSFAEFRHIPRLNILASSSMTNVLSLLVKQYSAKNNITIMVKYGPSKDLQDNINENPEEADIFITSKDDSIQELVKKRFVDPSTLTPLYANRLILISSKTNKILKKVTKDDDFNSILTKIRDRSVLVLSDPEESLLGFYSSQLLKNSGMWKFMSPVVAFSENSVSTLHLASAGYRTAIVYKSDLFHNPNVDTLLEIPSHMHPPIIYQAIALKNNNEFYSKKFLAFLKSKEAKKMFEQFGFEKLPADAKH